jgi:hypothetical protein
MTPRDPITGHEAEMAQHEHEATLSVQDLSALDGFTPPELTQYEGMTDEEIRAAIRSGDEWLGWSRDADDLVRRIRTAIPAARAAGLL